MKPIPVDFHIGPLLVHTYGIGLAVTFWFAYSYFLRRLRSRSLPTEWLSKGFLWIVLAAIVGARLVHVVANISYYSSAPSQIPLIWHGGLSSFGGLAGGMIAGLIVLRRSTTPLRAAVAFDVLTPVLSAAWAMGRLLGPQLMYAGGGRPTSAWYGLQYAGESGYRIPVPLFQASEDLIIFGVLLLIERSFRNASMPFGLLALIGLSLWSVERFFDEYLWLAVPRLWDSVEVFSILLFISSTTWAWILVRRSRPRTTFAAEPLIEGRDDVIHGTPS